MFGFSRKNADGSIDMLDVITSELRRLSASKLAFYRAVSLIEHAIARSEIILQKRGQGMVRDADYYRLNIRPNTNEDATYFWGQVTRRLLVEGECLIVPLGDGLYIGDSWSESDAVTRERRYSSITLMTAGQMLTIQKSFRESDVMHIRYDNAKIRACLAALMAGYDETIDAVSAMLAMTNRPKFILSVRGMGSMGNVGLADASTGKLLTRDAYAKKLLEILQEDKSSILTLSEGIDLRQMEIKSSMSPAELQSLVDTVNKTTAQAFDIPWEVFSGSMTEKSDGSNEFITYAVAPVAQAITEALNSSFVGYDDYLAGERATVWLGAFAHRDLMDSASALDKLRGVGFSLDELREAVGYVPLDTEFSQRRALTLNYSTEDKNGNEN